MANVTVIVPVYNGAKYIERSLETVFDQDIDDLEVIVVDDGSEDDSGQIAERVFSRRARKGISTKLVHQENKGGSCARNKGILHANGNYILFFDSDDLMNKGLLKELHEKATETEADIAICGYDWLDEADNVIKPYEKFYSYFEETVDGQTAALMMLRSRIRVWTSNAMYRTEFLNRESLRFTKGCLCIQDGEFILKALCLAESVSCVNQSLVRYVQRKGSLSRQTGMRIFHAVGAMKRVKSFFKRNGAASELVRLMDESWIPPAYARALYACQIGNIDRKRLKRIFKHPAIRNVFRSYTPQSKSSQRKLFFLRNFPRLYFKYKTFRAKHK